tara:strand:- start:193304 stop:194131 length:828 start_codon:yes stop_codon:yes gene_type:complete
MTMNFLERHTNGPMIRMPNAWNPGTAKIMQDAGADAIGTTSAGIVYAAGLPDYEGALTWDECLRATEAMCAAVDIPVSVDSEDGYGDTPEEVANTFTMLIQAGAEGGSIEDHPRSVGSELISAEKTAEHIAAAREAIDRSGKPFVLTARAECFLVGHPEKLAESIRRIQLYEDAGADCLYVPGLRKREDIAAVLDAVSKPVNVLVGIKGFDIPLDALDAMGVRRVSTGGSIACATLGLVRQAVQQMMSGDLSYRDLMITHDELTALFGEGPAAGI